MAAAGSFREHIGWLLAEHESLQQSLADLRQEHAKLQERFRLARLDLAPENLSPQPVEPLASQAVEPIASQALWDSEPFYADSELPEPEASPVSTHSSLGLVQRHRNRTFRRTESWQSPSKVSHQDFPEEPPDLWEEYRKPQRSVYSVQQVPWTQKAQNMICGEAMIDHKSQLQRLVIRPNSHLRALWDCICILMLGYDIIFLPLEAFTLSEPILRLGTSMDIASTCFWTLDILMTFFTGYHTQGIVEMRPRRIVARYLQSLFVLDFTIVSGDWYMLFRHQLGDIPYIYRTTRSIRLVRMMRAVRLMRVLNMAKRVMLRFNIMNSELLWTLFSLSSMFIVLMIFNHYIACGWFALGNTSNNGWIQAAGIDVSDTLYCYMTSLHFALTQHAPASMEVHAVNLQERIYSVFVLLFGMVCFSSFVSSITSAVMHLRKIKTERAQQEATLRQYFQESKISAELGQRIWLFLQNNHFQHRKRVHRNDLDILRLVPVSMMNDLNEELYLPVLEMHPFFKCLFINHPDSVHEVCCRCVTERFLLREEELFTTNTQAENMSFINMGAMYYHHSHVELCTSVNAGQWICEHVLWLVWKYCGVCTAKTSCEVIQLHAGSFRTAIRRDFLSHNFASAHAKRFRSLLLNNELWYTDIWSLTMDFEADMQPRQSRVGFFLDTVRLLPVGFRWSLKSETGSDS